MGLFDIFKSKCSALASEHTAGIAKPLEKVPPTDAEIKVSAATTTAWETAKQKLIDGDDNVKPISESDALIIVGPKPVDLSDDSKWPTVEKPHAVVAAFIDNGLWADSKTTLYILAEATAQLLDESKHSDDTLKNKLNEVIAAVNLIIARMPPPVITSINKLL